MRSEAELDAPGARRRVRIDLAYDGTGLSGWQRQPAAPTVQGELEQALSRLQGDVAVTVHGAGRTDAGVHAVQQVAHADLATALDDERLRHALAALLPPSIRPWSLRTVAPGFDSRRDAVGKTYQYLLDRTTSGDPFLARYAFHVSGPLRLDDLRRALALLPGTRDWAGFAGAAGQVRTTVRELTRAGFSEHHGLGTFVFRADGFLNYMVRNLVGTLLEIARGRLPVGTVAEVLESRDRGRAGPTAPARGVCLVRVRYAHDEPERGSDQPWILRSPLPRPESSTRFPTEVEP